jgi:hypothetical protein
MNEVMGFMFVRVTDGQVLLAASGFSRGKYGENGRDMPKRRAGIRHETF